MNKLISIHNRVKRHKVGACQFEVLHSVGATERGGDGSLSRSRRLYIEERR